MAKKLISYDDAAATGQRLPAPVRTEVAALASGGVSSPGGVEAFVAKADMGAPTLGIALAGDSTGDESAEWFRRGIGMWLTERTSMKATYSGQYGDSGPYATNVIQGGASTPTTVYEDTFTRTAADLFGTTPDIGVAYTGGAGGFSLDGASAVSLGGSAGIVQDTATLVAAGGRRRLLANISFDTTPGASTKRLEVYLGAGGSARIQLMMQVTTGGVISWEIKKTIAGTTTTVTPGTGTPLAASTVNTVDVSLEVNGTTVTAVLNGVEITGTLTSGDVTAAVDPATRVDFQTAGSASASAIKINSIRLERWSSGGAQELTIFNGSRSGSTLQHQQDRLAALYPTATAIDLLCISSSHNYGTAEPAAYIAAIDAFITAYRALHPESGIMICSQNPEYAPIASTSRARHLRRLASLRAYARSRGYAYLPVAELFAAQSDGGVSWVKVDGVHPTYAGDVADPNNGSYQWAALFADALNAASLAGEAAT